MGNKKINEVAESIAIHMQELLEDTVDWQMKEFYGMVPAERNKVMKLSIKKLKSLVDKETKRILTEQARYGTLTIRRL